jgi:hypothetical protein
MVKRLLARTAFGTLVSLGIVLAAGGAACGGAKNNDLFGGASFGDGAVVGADGSGVGGDSGVLPGADASTLPDASSEAGRRDAGRDADPDDPGIRCGNMGAFCAVGSHVCCRSALDQFTCTTFGNCNSVGSMAIPCDDTADCAKLGLSGKLCCATVDTLQGRATEVTCRSQGDCTTNASRYVLCDPNLPTAVACPNNGVCRLSSQTLPGFYLCF